MMLWQRFKAWWENYWHWPLLIMLAASFFVGVSAYNYLTQSNDFVKWSSPDETANYFLAKNFAERSQLTYEEKYNLLADGIIRPRSLRADGAFLKPLSFLGLPLVYGTLAKLTGAAALPYLTPLLAALGLIFYYLIIKKLFGKTNALLSTILLTFFPVYIYYSARSMFHNIPFIVFLLIGLYFALLMGDRALCLAARSSWPARLRGWLFSVLAGYFVGLAATIRSSELLWLAPVLLLLWLFNCRRLGLMKPLLFVYFLVLAWLPVLFFNYVLYGSYLASGYPALEESLANISAGGVSFFSSGLNFNWQEAKAALQKIYHNFFYFGFHPEQSRQMFVYYVKEMFPWLWYLGGAGLVIFCLQFWRRKASDLIYLLSWGLASLLLVFYYGSWKFFDNPNVLEHTIGNSYTRYWLPLYLGALPFVSLLIMRLSRLLEFKLAKRVAQLAAVAVIGGISLLFVLYGSEEGLLASVYRQQAARTEFEQVIAATPPEAIIITRYHDKLFFPERRVIVGLLDDSAMNLRYARLAKDLPVYYYNFSLTPTDLAYSNASKLAAVGLKMELIKKITPDFSLYSLKLSPNKKALK